VCACLGGGRGRRGAGEGGRDVRPRSWLDWEERLKVHLLAMSSSPVSYETQTHMKLVQGAEVIL
jgi:hypothetical protein